MKKLFTLLLACILVMATTGCAQNTTSGSSVQPSSPASSTSSHLSSLKSESVVVESETYLFTDSSGREVELPKDIERIAPSGPLAQIVLYTLCPEKMVGWATEFTELQQKYIDSKYASLPVFGNFYADTLNLEAVMTAKPQIVFDIGEAKATVKEDVEGIQDKTGIPSVFVEMEVESMATAYETLGKIIGEEERAQKFVDYIQKTQSDTEAKLKDIPDNERTTVYYGQDNGVTAVVAGTVHADVIDYAGGINVAQVEETVRGGASEISMEQLLLWNPDVILLSPESIYGDISQQAEWQELAAIKGEHYYEIPDEPYNWMGKPPSVNRILGIKWLSNLLYPEVFNYDMVKETQEFYQLFYHCDITEEQVKELLNSSTYKP